MTILYTTKFGNWMADAILMDGDRGSGPIVMGNLRLTPEAQTLQSMQFTQKLLKERKERCPSLKAAKKEAWKLRKAQKAKAEK